MRWRHSMSMTTISIINTANSAAMMRMKTLKMISNNSRWPSARRTGKCLKNTWKESKNSCNCSWQSIWSDKTSAKAVETRQAWKSPSIVSRKNSERKHSITIVMINSLDRCRNYFCFRMIKIKSRKSSPLSIRRSPRSSLPKKEVIYQSRYISLVICTNLCHWFSANQSNQRKGSEWYLGTTRNGRSTREVIKRRRSNQQKPRSKHKIDSRWQRWNGCQVQLREECEFANGSINPKFTRRNQ